MSSSEGLELVSVSSRKDPAWKHCEVFVKIEESPNGVGNKVELKKCLYCGKMFKGGGIHRLKEHLAGRKGNGPICDEAPEEVRVAMLQCLNNVGTAKKRKNNSGGGELGSKNSRKRGNSRAKNRVRGGKGGVGGDGVVSKALFGDEDGDGTSEWDVERGDGNGGSVNETFASALRARGFDDLLGEDEEQRVMSLPGSSGGGELGEEKLDGVLGSKNLRKRGDSRAKNRVRGGSGDGVVSGGRLGCVGGLVSKALFGEEEDVGMSEWDVERGDGNRGRVSESFASALRARGIVDLVDEDDEQRVASFPGSSGLVRGEEENGVGKKKRLVNDGEERGNSDGLGSERGDNRRIQVAIGRFLYEIGVPLDAVKESVYFQPMIDVIASGESEVSAPLCHDLRGWILKDVVDEVKKDVDLCKTRWEKTGCSLLASQWNSGKGQTFLNFSVYCPQRTVFIKSVDVSSIVHSADALHHLFKQVVEEVGAQHILQVITHNEENYMVVGKRLMESFPTLYWSPCAAHSIELMLKDFAEIEWIKSTIEQARSVTRYIYNHISVLNIMRSYTFGIDIVRPGESPFATDFMTLKQMANLKLNLQSMVTSPEWLGLSSPNKVEGMVLIQTLASRSFWSSCVMIAHLMAPLLKVLHIVGSQKRPAMAYVFAGIYQAKEVIKRELPSTYMVYWNIIDRHWENLWHVPLHSAGFFLNPKLFFSMKGDVHNNVVSGVFDCIERLVSDIGVQDSIAKEINLYKDSVGDLGRNLAVRARDTVLPAEWWSTYGGSCPFLAHFAVRVLSQTCSLAHHKPNQTSFGRLLETSNCIERQRLNDLVFVQHNLQLSQLSQNRKAQEYGDPLSIDRKSVVGEWITEKEVNLQNDGSVNWKALDQPSVNSMLLEISANGAEEFCADFDDAEIFNGLKEV